MRSVLRDDTVGLAPLSHVPPPDGLTTVPLLDEPPSPPVLTWPATNPDPLVRSLVAIATGDRERGTMRNSWGLTCPNVNT